ncbi:MAG TPA: beta/gamma crystallin family protein [Caldimonas sp.]|jgi:uncharacterized protein YcfJ|nr:beta/gamma crystallin family protein [Caldimonas sp.]HEX2543082.1 beta/gamma crystallin family protein [Caldimonas sp.]
MNMTRLRPVLAAAAVVASAGASAQITFYEGEGFRGRAFSTDRPVRDMERQGFNDRAASVVVDRGRWEVCEDARFEGRCVLLRRGSYESLRDTGLSRNISSVRPADNRRRYDNEAQAAMETPNYAYRQRPNERTFEAPVTSVRAVAGTPEQRCWMERQEVQERRELNPAGGVIGGIIGGILGHQIGSGSGNTAATIGGAVGGAALGANIDRIRDPRSGREIRRCENVASAQPEYWDVVYNFRGTDHRVQMTSPPGRTILVNARGEPRQ